MVAPAPALGLEGRSIIITGAAGGIGGATARLAVQNGMRVLAVDVAADRLHAFVADVGAGDAMAAHVADLGDTAAIPGVVEAAVGRFGRVDALIHCAALMMREFDITRITDHDWDRQVAVNERGSWFIVRDVAEQMRRQGGGGSIVMFASVGAFTGGLGGSWVYSATKGAVVTMVRGFAKTYSPYGIRVNAVSPGTTNTDMFTAGVPPERIAQINAMVPLKRVAEPSEQGTAALFLVSDWASYVSGVTLDVDGAWLVR
jgi:NAD(P)-dependent dehydrogenase (short-subunit alcohol dehydrogenase family)